MTGSDIVSEPSESLRKAGTVVVVDDDAHALRALQRSLAATFDVAAYDTAGAAIERVRKGGVSAVLSDIAMPAMTGLELLRAIRRLDPDLPVILVTGAPSLSSATEAIEHGVFRYLTKPFEHTTLNSTVEKACQLYRLARTKREALALHGTPGASDRVGLELTLLRALETLTVAVQPIVSVSARSVFGFEALMRSGDPALPNPHHVLEAAEKLGMLERVGRKVRNLAAGVAQLEEGRSALLFVNLHPRDLMDPDLVQNATPLAGVAPRVVLEMTERASLAGLDEVQAKVAALRGLGFRIAIDDLGAGYAGLSSFALLEPEFVKVDMSLTRDIDSSSVKQRLVHSLTGLCRDMGMTIIVEGVETVAERDVLVDLGCDLLQGYLFARPGPAFPSVNF